jgi:hypothetical protein
MDLLDYTEPKLTDWRVHVQTQHLSLNPHGHTFMFLFILEAQTGPGNILVLILNS